MYYFRAEVLPLLRRLYRISTFPEAATCLSLKSKGENRELLIASRAAAPASGFPLRTSAQIGLPLRSKATRNATIPSEWRFLSQQGGSIGSKWTRCSLICRLVRCAKPSQLHVPLPSGLSTTWARAEPARSRSIISPNAALPTRIDAELVVFLILGCLILGLPLPQNTTTPEAAEPRPGFIISYVKRNHHL